MPDCKAFLSLSETFLSTYVTITLLNASYYIKTNWAATAHPFANQLHHTYAYICFLYWDYPSCLILTFLPTIPLSWYYTQQWGSWYYTQQWGSRLNHHPHEVFLYCHQVDTGSPFSKFLFTGNSQMELILYIFQVFTNYGPYIKFNPPLVYKLSLISFFLLGRDFFLNLKNPATLICLHIVLWLFFALQQQSWIVGATERIRVAKHKIFTIWPFTEKDFQLLFQIIYVCNLLPL